MQRRGPIWGFGIGIGAIAALAVAVEWAHGQDAQPLKAKLVLDRNSYVVGQPVFFAVVLENTGSEPVRARLGRKEYKRFGLEIADTNSVYKMLRYLYYGPSMFYNYTLRPFQPGEQVGTSGAILLSGDSPAPSAVGRKPFDLADYLIWHQPGKYKLRAVVVVEFDASSVTLYSNEVLFEITPPAKSTQVFVEFAARHIGDQLELSEVGYTRGPELVQQLEGTPYAAYVKWAMMMFYKRHRMEDEEQPGESLTAEERTERESYKQFAEKIVAAPADHITQFRETALEYLVQYSYAKGDLNKALEYAEKLCAEVPWSKGADAVQTIQEAIQARRKASAPTDY